MDCDLGATANFLANPLWRRTHEASSDDAITLAIAIAIAIAIAGRVLLTNGSVDNGAMPKTGKCASKMGVVDFNEIP